MAVFEPSTGFTIGGRILVFGDHNMFADSYINSSDNLLLATNMVAWASTQSAVPEPTTLAIWSALGGLGMMVAARRRRRAA